MKEHAITHPDLDAREDKRLARIYRIIGYPLVDNQQRIITVHPYHLADSLEQEIPSEHPDVSFGRGGDRLDPIYRQFKHEASQVRMTTIEESQALGILIDMGKRAHKASHTPGKKTSTAEEFAGDIAYAEKARQLLILSHFRLTVQNANKYLHRGIPFLDLVQEGNLGLMRAAKKYDWRRGSFSGFATRAIVGQMIDAIYDHSSNIRLSDEAQAMLRKIFTAQTILINRNEKPTTAAIYEQLGHIITEAEIEHLLTISQDQIEIENLSGDHDDSDSEHMDEHHSALLFNDSAESDTETNELRQILLSALSQLSPRDSLVMQYLYGLKDGIAYTEEEVAELLNLPETTIHPLAKRARKFLRENYYYELLPFWKE